MTKFFSTCVEVILMLSELQKNDLSFLHVCGGCFEDKWEDKFAYWASKILGSTPVILIIGIGRVYHFK